MRGAVCVVRGLYAMRYAVCVVRGLYAMRCAVFVVRYEVYAMRCAVCVVRYEVWVICYEVFRHTLCENKPHPANRTTHPAPRTPHPANRTTHPAPRTPQTTNHKQINNYESSKQNPTQAKTWVYHGWRGFAGLF